MIIHSFTQPVNTEQHICAKYGAAGLYDRESHCVHLSQTLCSVVARRVGSAKLSRIGVFTPQESANATDQACAVFSAF